jgi:transcription termination/antitermination protein NusG
MRTREVNETDPMPEERELDLSQEADAEADVPSSEAAAEPVTHDERVESADRSVDQPTVEDDTEPAAGSSEPEVLEPEPEAPEESASAGQESQDPEPAQGAVSVEPEVGPADADAEPDQAPAAEAEIAPAEPEPDPAEAVAVSDDPFRGNGDWYVVHTYSGYENKVKANLESRIHTMQMEGKIFGVHIPMEDVMEIKSGKKQVVKKKQFPGYLLVRMIYDNDSWYVVRNTPGVTGFVSAGTGSKPTPLSRHEVEKILAVKKEEVRPQVRLGFEEGDVVRITSGPFADFNGTINEINPDQAKLKVLVNIFDRETPVELSFDQVSKV